MAREIRITINDDEVFERMKRRKEQLDLSWEEVLYRGLRQAPTEPGDLADEIKRQVSDHVRRSISSSLEGAGPTGPAGSAGSADHPFDEPGFGRGVGHETGSGGSPGVGFEHSTDPYGSATSGDDDLDSEVDALSSAEDATLVFDFLDEKPENQIPLRVTLETSREGLDVDVVAVRRGKSAESMNRFDQAERRTITVRLAKGEAATLQFADGAEAYHVRPVLSWSRSDDDRPIVSEVEIDEVILDDDE